MIENIVGFETIDDSFAKVNFGGYLAIDLSREGSKSVKDISLLLGCAPYNGAALRLVAGRSLKALDLDDIMLATNFGLLHEQHMGGPYLKRFGDAGWEFVRVQWILDLNKPVGTLLQVRIFL